MIGKILKPIKGDLVERAGRASSAGSFIYFRHIRSTAMIPITAQTRGLLQRKAA
jgi:hypothetical protein